jgi:hypothetical protein
MDNNFSDRAPNSSLFENFMHVIVFVELRLETHLRSLPPRFKSTSDVVHGTHPLALLHDLLMRKARVRLPSE